MTAKRKKLPSWASKRRGTKAEMIGFGYPEAELVEDENGQFAWAPKQRLVGRLTFKRSAPGEMAALVKRAKAGNSPSALRALKCFCEAQERGDNVPPEILSWLREAFRLVLAGSASSLNQLLQLPSLAAHRPVENGLATRNRKIARRVNALVRDGKSKKEAILTAKEEFNVSSSTADKAWTAYNASLYFAKEARQLTLSEGKQVKDLLFPEERKALYKK